MGLCLRGCFLRNSLSQSLRQYPLSHGLRRASSPKGTPLVAVAKLLAKVQSFRQRSCLSLWERWICEAKTERAHAVSLDAKASDAIRNFAATAEAVPLGKVA